MSDLEITKSEGRRKSIRGWIGDEQGFVMRHADFFRHESFVIPQFTARLERKVGLFRKNLSGNRFSMRRLATIPNGPFGSGIGPSLCSV